MKTQSAKGIFSRLIALGLMIVSSMALYAQNCSFNAAPPTLNLTGGPVMVSGGCEYTVKLTFTIDYTNSGQKQIYAHFWNGSVPSGLFTGVNDEPRQSSELANALGTLVFLVNNDKTLTVQNTYWPDNNVTKILSGVSINLVNPNPMDLTVVRYEISNIKLVIPCASAVSFKAGIWSTNAEQGSSVHCSTGGGGIVLPAKFGTVKATKKSGQVHIEWQALSEDGVKEYLVEASADGSNWREVGKLASKATNGSSDSSINYELTVGAAGIAIAGLAFAFLFFPLVRSKTARFLIGAVLLVAAGSCMKNGTAIDTEEHSDLWIRVVQHDIDGGSAVSKVVKVVEM